MKVPISQYSRFFELLQSDSLNNSQIFLFVAIDCDAICACRIVKAIFDYFRIQNTTVPISCIQDLLNSYSNMIEKNLEASCLFLINCGGIIDLFELFHLDRAPTSLNVYVLDSHRPYHIENVRNVQQIFLFDDSTDLEPSFEGSVAESDGLDHVEVANMDEIWGESDLDSSDSLLQPESNGSTSHPTRSNGKRGHVGLIAAGDPSHHGFTSAGLAYILCNYLGPKCKELVWYAILGLTDQFIHQRIDKNRYLAEMDIFRQVVIMDYPQNDELEQEDDYSRNDPNRVLFIPDDFVFMLYRHWNLYDSLFYTREVAIRLGIWKRLGHSKLDYWLAKMGLPLEVSKQSYFSMQKRYKDCFLQSLKVYESEELDRTVEGGDGISGFRFASFSKTVQNKEVSASDVIYSMSALLEFTIQSDENGKQQDFVKRNFWRAYCSISDNGLEVLDEGIRLAILLQKEIVKQAIQIVQKNMVGKSGPYRYCFLKESSENQCLLHPLALSKLAHFLVDLLIETKKFVKCKPLILAVLLQDNRTFLLLGVEGHHSSSSYIPNSFGRLFAYAAEKTNIEMTYSTFDTSIVRIRKEDLEKFRECLRTGLMAQ